MNPFFGVSPFYLRLNQTSKFAFYSPSAPIPFCVSDFEYNLNALLVKRVNIDPYALIEKFIHNP